MSLRRTAVFATCRLEEPLFSWHVAYKNCCFRDMSPTRTAVIATFNLTYISQRFPRQFPDIFPTISENLITNLPSYVFKKSFEYIFHRILLTPNIHKCKIDKFCSITSFWKAIPYVSRPKIITQRLNFMHREHATLLIRPTPAMIRGIELPSTRRLF